MLPYAFIFSSNLFHAGLMSFKLIAAWTKIIFIGKGSLVLKWNAKDFSQWFLGFLFHL